jgi:hypothetical protein
MHHFSTVIRRWCHLLTPYFNCLNPQDTAQYVQIRACFLFIAGKQHHLTTAVDLSSGDFSYVYCCEMASGDHKNILLQGK